MNARQSIIDETTQFEIIQGFQAKLDTLTRKWWLYLLLLLLFCLPSYAARGYDPRKSIDLVGQVLSGPLIFAFPVLMPLAKIMPIALISGLLAVGNRARRAFNVYVAVLYLALAILQTTAVTEAYGLVVLTGNLALILVVALGWIWEAIAGQNDFGVLKLSLWRWWVIPLALAALLFPLDPSTMSLDFNPVRLLANEAGLTYCMLTPLVLAVLILFFPAVNLPVLRISSFAGMIFGAVNLVMWFGVQPWGWWMGVMHLPLVVSSVYAFGLAQTRLVRQPFRLPDNRSKGP